MKKKLVNYVIERFCKKIFLFIDYTSKTKNTKSKISKCYFLNFSCDLCLQTKRNDELSIELLNLVNAKAALMKQIHALSDSDPGVGDPEAEVSRVKAFVIKNSTGKVKVIHPPFIYIASDAVHIVEMASRNY